MQHTADRFMRAAATRSQRWLPGSAGRMSGELKPGPPSVLHFPLHCHDKHQSTHLACASASPQVFLDSGILFDAECVHMQNYNQTRHDHEIMLESGTQLQEVTDDDAEMGSIPRMLYNVRPLCLPPFLPTH